MGSADKSPTGTTRQEHSSPLTIAVLGAGSWGTALAHHLRRTGATVRMWGRDAQVLHHIAQACENPKYVKGRKLASGIIAEPRLEFAVKDADLIVLAVPSIVLRSVLAQIAAHLQEQQILVSGIKGLESETLKTPTQVVLDEVGPNQHIAALGGPSFAGELVEGYPTALTVAAHSPKIAEVVRRAFHFGNVRVYSSTDVMGVELGGAVKNVIALATGLVDGVGMGQNARAALITRGLAEIQELVLAAGGDPRTVSGLAGLGDLLLTAVGDQSRNRRVGLRLGAGEELEAITRDLGEVAEGVRSTHLVLELARRLNVDMPIVEQVDAVLTKKRTVAEAVAALLAREPKQEIKGKSTAP